MQTMLAAERMQQSAIWTASLHYNTDNIHVHIATVEPHPTRDVMNVFDKETNTWREEYRAKRKPKTLDKMKSKRSEERRVGKEWKTRTSGSRVRKKSVKREQ